MVTDILTIRTGGQTLSGWLTSQVTRGVEITPSWFEISLTERYPGDFKKAVVLPGSECTVYLGADLILTGYVDEYSPSYDGHTHNVRISGRSNTEDVVDSSIYKRSQFANNQSLLVVVKQLLQQTPNVKVTMVGTDVGLPFPYNVEIGESVYSVIETLCRMCSKLVWDDKDGNLVISDVGTDRAGSSLVEGVNVLAAATRINWVQRFHRLIVMSAGDATGTLNGPTVSEATDAQVRDSRTKVVLMDMYPGLNFEFSRQRAAWEMNRRIGRSLITEIHVVGWRDGNGKLWTPNSIVHVSLPEQKIESDLVITRCDWKRDENGTTTVLECMPKNALQPQPYIPIAGVDQIINR